MAATFLSKAECLQFLAIFEEAMIDCLRSKLITILDTKGPFTADEVTVPPGPGHFQEAITVDTIRKARMEATHVWLLLCGRHPGGELRKRFTDAAADLHQPAEILFQVVHAARHGDRLPTQQQIDNLLSFSGWIGDIGERISTYRGNPNVQFLPQTERAIRFVKESVRLLCVLPSAATCLRSQDWLSLRSMKFKSILVFSHKEIQVAATDTLRQISATNWATSDGFIVEFRRIVAESIKSRQRAQVTIVFLSCNGFQLPDSTLAEVLKSYGAFDPFPSKIHLIFGGLFSQVEINEVRRFSDTSMSPFSCQSAHISQYCWALVNLANSLGYARCLDLPLALINAGVEHILPTTIDDVAAADDSKKFYCYQQPLTASAARHVPRREVVQSLVDAVHRTRETTYTLTYDKPSAQPILHGMTSVLRHVLYSLVQESAELSCLFIPTSDQSEAVCKQVIAFASANSQGGRLVVGVDRGVVSDLLLSRCPVFHNVVWIVVATRPKDGLGTRLNVPACLVERERAGCMDHMKSLFDGLPTRFDDWQSYIDDSCAKKMPLAWAPLMLCQPEDGDRWVDRFLLRAMNDIREEDRVELMRLALFQCITRGSGLITVEFEFWNDVSPMNYLLHVFRDHVTKDNGCYCLTGDFVVRWLVGRLERSPTRIRDITNMAGSFIDEPYFIAVFSPNPENPHAEGPLVAFCEKASESADASVALINAFVGASVNVRSQCDFWGYMTAVVNAYTCRLKDEYEQIPRKPSFQSFDNAVKVIGQNAQNAAVGLHATVQLRKYLWLRSGDGTTSSSSSDTSAAAYKEAWQLFEKLFDAGASLPVFRMTGGFALVSNGSVFEGYDEVTCLKFAVRLTEVLCFQFHSDFVRRQGVGRSLCNALTKHVFCQGWLLPTAAAEEWYLLLRVLRNQVQWPPAPLVAVPDECKVLSKEVWQSTPERHYSLAIASQYLAFTTPLQYATTEICDIAAQHVIRPSANSPSTATFYRVCPGDTLFAYIGREKKWRIWTFASQDDLDRPSACLPPGDDVDGRFYFINRRGEKLYCGKV